MLASADRSIADVIRFFAQRGVEAGFLVPTSTGLAKSILDAHEQLRAYLRKRGFHDYETQSQGEGAKVSATATILGVGSSVSTRASLYRPETKSGDPRIWFFGLSNHVAAGNLLAVFAIDGELFVANVSDDAVLASADSNDSPLGRLIARITAVDAGPAEELLAKLRAISAKGFVRSERNGPTGVGYTLESLLGIKANSSKLPDYKGIEIKAARAAPRGARGNRVTLFSRVPDWAASAMPDARTLLQVHGYDRRGRRQLNCSISNVANTLGFFLKVDGDDLHVRRTRGDACADVLRWPLAGLQSALEQKHKQTFWVKARMKKDLDGVEMFQYESVIHTRSPMTTNLPSLFDFGQIELDFVMHLVIRGEGQPPRARDHGYLFKLHPSNLELLFPPPRVYSLAE